MFIQFESNKIDERGFQNIFFENPVSVISCFRVKEVRDCICKMDLMLSRGYYLAGFFSYEAGFAFEEILFSDKKFDFPLIWFGVFKKPEHVNPLAGGLNKNKITRFRPSISKEKYLKSIGTIKKYISSGETYQVNFTYKYKFDFSGNPYSFYGNLKTKQAVPYSAFIDAGEFNVISLSPEMFFEKTGTDIIVEPMKGTINRGINSEEDEYMLRLLKNDGKNKSENIMIVDLLRNDIGRIAKKSSVRVVNLFDIKKYETLFQMTSRIRAKIDKSINLYDLFSSVFPSGSVTGAPKLRTMEIIRELENENRKIYTGAIGYITPKKDMLFNVAIRTILLCGSKGEMGIGSGIIADSIAGQEYNECKLKAEFLTRNTPDFDLIETLLWKNGRFVLLKEHILRLKDSSNYFGFMFDKKGIFKKLDDLAAGFDKDRQYKVRVLLSKSGCIKASYSEIVLNPNCKGDEKIVVISKNHTNSHDPFLYHKTTNRRMYDNEYRHYGKRGYFDVIFLNEKNEVTEGAVTNIFIKKKNRMYTPPVRCGLLNGVFRKNFINKNDKVSEKIIHPKDLLDADEIFVCNSVKGMKKVFLEAF